VSTNDICSLGVLAEHCPAAMELWGQGVSWTTNVRGGGWVKAISATPSITQDSGLVDLVVRDRSRLKSEWTALAFLSNRAYFIMKSAPKCSPLTTIFTIFLGVLSLHLHGRKWPPSTRSQLKISDPLMFSTPSRYCVVQPTEQSRSVDWARRL